MNIRLKKKIEVINDFNKIQISNMDLMKIKKMHIESEGTQRMKFKDNTKKNLPHNVLAEPVFDTELDAYLHYSKEYEIDELKIYGIAASRYSTLPTLKLNLTEEQALIKEEYDNLFTQISQALDSSLELREEILAKIEVGGMTDEISNEALSRKYLSFAANRWNVYKSKMEQAILNIPLTIAVDTGKANTKVAYLVFDIESGTFKEETIVFPSLVSEVTSISTVMDSSILEAEGKKYIVDENARPVCSAKDTTTTGRTKSHEYHRILMIEAHRQVVDRTGRSIFNTVVGYSLDSYKSDKGALVYLTMINDTLPDEYVYECENGVAKKDNKGVKIQLDPKVRKENSIKRMNELMDSFEGINYEVYYGKDYYNIQINDLILAPETFSSISTFKGIEWDTEEYHNTYVIDIGGLNRSVAIIRNGQKLLDLSITGYKGMSHILSKATEFLESNAGDYSASSTDSLDVSYVEREIKYLNKSSNNDDLNDFLFDYFDELTTELQRLKDAGLNRNSKLIFVGGVAQYLKQFILSYYSSDELGIKLKYKPQVEPNGLFSNVLGMLKAGQAQFGRRLSLRKVSA